jgi:hypothetical protein
MTLLEAFVVEFRTLQVLLRKQLSMKENGSMRTEDKAQGSSGC